MPEPTAFEVELAIEKLKRHNHHVLIKSQQNLLRHDVGQIALRSINLLFLFGIRRNCLRSGRNRLLYLSIRRTIKQTVVILGAYQFANYVQTLTNILLSRLIPYEEEIIGDHLCGFRRNRSATHIFCVLKILEK